jgi:hypothetical protein
LYHGTPQNNNENSHSGEKIGIRRIIKGGVEKLGCLAISIVASAAASAIA